MTQRLDYLKTLGIDAIWLTPFYISPQVDNGYDVANYTAIDPAYGTLDDFDELVARRMNAAFASCWIWCLTTRQPSTRFRESLNKASPYRQFYIWRDGTPEQLPNNWRSKFGGNAALARRERAVLSAPLRPGAGGSQLEESGRAC